MGNSDNAHFTEKQKKIISIILLLVFLAFTGIICWFIGKPMIEFASEPEKFRDWIDSKGALAPIIFIGMVTFQVVFAIIPGEPLEIGAGYAFGAFEGTVLCVIGITIGSLLVFALVRTFGVRIVEVFFSIEKIRSMKFLQNTKRLGVVTFLVFFIPGTPKDLLSYFVGLTEIKVTHWLIIASLARLPSVITSTYGGSALGNQQYIRTVIIFAATALVSGVGVLVYKAIKKHIDKQPN